MSAVGSPFTQSDIRALAQDPNRDLASLRSGSGFSYPQRNWMYSAAAAYYEQGRDREALWARLDDEVARGQGPTSWKLSRSEEVRLRLETFLELDRRAVAPFLVSAKTSPDAVMSWRDHLIRVPLGFIMQSPEGPFMRLLWTERVLLSGRRGVTMVVVATLAVAELAYGKLAGIETWHLREGHGAPRSYSGLDLRALLPRFDRLLSQIEARLQGSPG